MVKKYVLTRQSQDLTLMRKAILQGISEYHAKKMSLVNRLLDRYWRNIYCGNDIISIYISCEQATTGANQGKYSYKIMAKRKIGDTGSSVECFGNHNTDYFITDELRGRCSTGQKAIACIVIRLALSQAFCSTTNACRIFALDEPTTSLDRSTIKSFAHSIFKMIDVFKEAGNPIQLVIITHDSDFMRELYKKRREAVSDIIAVRKDNKGYTELKNCQMIDIIGISSL